MYPEVDTRVEDALHTYPRAKAPRGFASRVMQQVRSHPRPAPFHLRWLDLLLGVMPGLLFGSGYLAWTFLPDEFGLHMSHAGLWLRLPVLGPLISASLAGAGLLAVSALVIGLVVLGKENMFRV